MLGWKPACKLWSENDDEIRWITCAGAICTFAEGGGEEDGICWFTAWPTSARHRGMECNIGFARFVSARNLLLTTRGVPPSLGQFSTLDAQADNRQSILP